MAKIFISYRREDSEGYVGRLYDNLVETFGPDEVFLDVVNLELDIDFTRGNHFPSL
jgi:hypothetical protein